MHNDCFLTIFNQSGITKYELSIKSGVKYSIVHNICSGQTNINNATATTVYRLALALNTPIESLLNPIFSLEGVSGHVGKTKYVWDYNGEVYVLKFKDNDKWIVYTTNYTQMPEEDMPYEKYIAAVIIKDYLEKEAFAKKWRNYHE